MGRKALRQAYHRLWWAPRARSVLTGRFFRRGGLDTSHLQHLTEGAERVGPLQREEALLIFSLLRVTRPLTVLEFGFADGRSAFNALRALSADARLYSLDNDAGAAAVARELFGHDARFRFISKSQADIEPADVDHREVDFVLLDASHDFELNRETFRRLVPMLSADAIVAVHDTGTMPRELIPPDWHPVIEQVWPHRWLDEHEYEHQPGERATVNWIRDECPEFAQTHLHTLRTVRWGITLLQRSRPLPTSGR